MAKGSKKSKLSGSEGTPEERIAPYLVFVSHASVDKWIAKTICEKIESVGAATFRDDRDIDGGDDIPEKIRRQIIRSNEVVVLLVCVHRMTESERRATEVAEKQG